MDRRTMGAFISALRKAAGMTQKELAEKLNVSDKSVSRWERDDGAPDLSLIPVIAEVFGVTCDELLRGERRAEAQPAETSAKGEKVCKRILAVSLSRYRSRSFIAMGISLAGLIAAMIGDLGFLRAYIGFFTGCIFFIVGAICQAVFINSALLSVDDDSLDGEGIAEFRGKVISLAKVSFGMTLILFAATLPLVVYVDDAYWGLSAGHWFRTGLIFALIALALWGAACYFSRGLLVKWGLVTMTEGAERKYRHNRRLDVRCAAVLLVIGFATLLTQAVVNNIFTTWQIAQGTEFEDYTSFAEFMEQDIPYCGEDNIAAEPLDPEEEIKYYDEDGNEITEEEFFREEIVIADGSPEGKVVCTFVRRNETVWSWRMSDTEDGLPITAVTHADLRAANRIVDAYNIGFAVLYGLELIGVIAYYLRKRIK